MVLCCLLPSLSAYFSAIFLINSSKLIPGYFLLLHFLALLQVSTASLKALINLKMKTMNSEEERIIHRIPWEIVIVSFILALVALFFFDALTALFFFAGGFFSAAGFLWLGHSLPKFLVSGKKKALQRGLAFYFLRLLLILIIFFIIITLFPRKLIAFVGGFSTIILVFFIEALNALSRIKKWKA